VAEGVRVGARVLRQELLQPVQVFLGAFLEEDAGARERPGDEAGVVVGVGEAVVPLHLPVALEVVVHPEERPQRVLRVADPAADVHPVELAVDRVLEVLAELHVGDRLLRGAVRQGDGAVEVADQVVVVGVVEERLGRLRNLDVSERPDDQEEEQLLDGEELPGLGGGRGHGSHSPSRCASERLGKGIAVRQNDRTKKWPA
jgi:hypothetical protein